MLFFVAFGFAWSYICGLGRNDRWPMEQGVFFKMYLFYLSSVENRNVEYAASQNQSALKCVIFFNTQLLQQIRNKT